MAQGALPSLDTSPASRSCRLPAAKGAPLSVASGPHGARLASLPSSAD